MEVALLILLAYCVAFHQCWEGHVVLIRHADSPISLIPVVLAQLINNSNIAAPLGPTIHPIHLYS